MWECVLPNLEVKVFGWKFNMLLTDIYEGDVESAENSDRHSTPPRRKSSVRKVYNRLAKYLAQGMRTLMQVISLIFYCRLKLWMLHYLSVACKIMSTKISTSFLDCISVLADIYKTLLVIDIFLTAQYKINFKAMPLNWRYYKRNAYSLRFS